MTDAGRPTEELPISTFSQQIETKKTLPSRPITFSEVQEQLRSMDFLHKLWELHSDTLQNSRESQCSVVRPLSSSGVSITEFDHGVLEGIGAESFGGDPLNEKDQVIKTALEVIHMHSHTPNFWFRPSDSDVVTGVAKALRNFAKIHGANGISIQQLRENHSLQAIYPDMRFDLPSRIPQNSGLVETAYRPYFLILQPISETTAQVLVWHDDPTNHEGKGTSEVFFDEQFGTPADLSSDPSRCKKIIEFFRKAGFEVGIGFLEESQSGVISFHEFPDGLFRVVTTKNALLPRETLISMVSNI